MIDPWLVGVGAMLGPKLLEYLTGKSSDRAAPTKVSRARAEKYTRVESGRRHFDRDLSDKLPRLLAAKSAVPVAVPASRRAPGARVFQVVPLRPDVPSAAAEIERARAEGRSVLGTLSLAYVWHRDADKVTMWIVTAPPSAEAVIADERGQLAVIDPPAPPAAVQAEPVEVAPVVELVTDKKAAANGAPKTKPVKPVAEEVPVEEAKR